MLAADGLRSLMLMKLFPWASATYIHFLEYCDERLFDFGPWLLSVASNETIMVSHLRSRMKADTYTDKSEDKDQVRMWVIVLV